MSLKLSENMSSGQNKNTADKAGNTVPVSGKRVLQPGKYELKNLKFLGDFMTTLGLTTTVAAKKAGLTQVTVYYWLKKDDAHLSSVEGLINAWGYKLEFELVSKEEESSMVRIETPNSRRLAFLERAMANVDREWLRQQLGIGTTTIYYWFSHDDIFISHIFRIAEILDKKVSVTIRPM